MKKNFLLFLTLLIGAVQPAMAIETAARQAVLIDATTHSVLFAKNADQEMHPSSMSKLMTIYILFSRMKAGKVNPDDKFAISEKAWRTQGSKSFVHIGDQIAVDDLIKGIIVQSGNDACVVVAEGLSGSEDAFAKEMNKTATEIGLQHSHFVNATGLPDPAHLMSARDLATLAERIIKDFPDYYHYFGIKEFTWSGITQQNRNRLLGVIGVDGLKTGHTDDGGYGITLSAKQGERRLILVVNGLESDNARIQEGDTLLRYGFREFENRTLVHKGQKVADAEVWFGKQASVPLVADQDILLTIPANDTKGISFTLKYNSPLAAPVTQGAQVAELVIKMPDREPQVVPLKAGADVAKLSGFAKIFPVLDYYVFHRQK